MSAPARLRVAASSGIYGLGFSGTRLSRSSIPTELEVNDVTLIDQKEKVTVLKKYNCSALVSDEKGNLTVINYDHLVKA